MSVGTTSNHTVIDSSALPTGASTSAIQATQQTSLTSIDGKITAVNTGAVVIASSALPALAATSTIQATQQTSLSAIDVSTAASATSLSVLDDWDESDRAKVNLIVGQAGIAAGTGVDGATVPRMSLATNVALPAGANVIGHVIADTGSTTAVTGNVTVVQPTGTNLHAVLDANSGVDIGKLTANQSVNVAQINAVTPLMGAGNTGTGSPRVTIASDQASIPVAATLQAGSALAGKVGIDQTTLGTTNGVTVTPSTIGGWSIFNATSGDGSTALTNSAQAIKGSQGTLGGWFIYNPNNVVAYVPIYNVASGSVTVGTTNPAMVLAIPAGSAANLELTNGLQFGTAMSAAACTTAAGNTALGTALDANFWYK